VETAVLAGLRAEMKSPKVLAEYVKTYHEERKRLSAEADANRTRLQRRAEKLKREIDRLVDHLAKGIGDPYVIGPRSTELHHEREAVLAELAKAPPAFEVVSLHPAILKRYEEQLENLQDARELVETVTVYRDPSEPGAVEIEIAGRLNSILGERAYPNGVKRVWGFLVAEEGLEPPTRGL
jgi:site-specific DNA recombinase